MVNLDLLSCSVLQALILLHPVRDTDVLHQVLSPSLARALVPTLAPRRLARALVPALAPCALAITRMKVELHIMVLHQILTSLVMTNPKVRPHF